MQAGKDVERENQAAEKYRVWFLYAKEYIMAHIVQEQKDQPCAKNKTSFRRPSTTQRRE